MRAFTSWMEYSQGLKANKTIDAENQRLIKNEAERWTEVLKRIVYLIEFLATQNLAFRGTTDVIYKKKNGNFLKLIEYVGKFDSIIAQHLRRIESKETNVHYLGKNIQNEIIALIGSTIRNFIANEVSRWTYYSIILDCTPDRSHTEQLTVVIRFVQCETGKKPCIKEHFLGFIPVESSTGESLTNLFLNKLKELNIPLSDMRGQSYDNGANMKARKKGVQKRVLELNPRAFFVPCCTHSLNLALTMQPFHALKL